ncbi:GNAT family N-acetyltransferase [Cellulomonas sp. CW35]|uniref:GNAT family N-acetyltransferase n=1 Tax=Cellulomonas sp. CW35 TaxID=3458249 RepID=UPI00403495EC
MTAVGPARPPSRVSTDRLVLRRFTRDDGAGLHAYLSRPEAVRFEPYDVQTRAQCDELATARAQDPSFWAVCRGSDGALVGNLYLHHDEPRGWHGYSLGYVFHPDEWHQGYATEACRALLDVCFRQWGAHRVSARCDPRNEASWRLLERLGLRREGHVRQAASFRTDDAGRPVWHDAYLYAVLDTEWDPEG